MFLANKLIKGLIDVVSNVDQFVPSDPPPPKRPLAYANQNETDEERQFRRVFQQLAGDDMEVSPNELMNMLNKIISKHGDLKTDGFTIESCRSMVAVMDSDSTGKLGFEEFKYLWNNIKRWQGIYKTFDADRSGLIGSNELPGAFKAAGEECSLVHFVLPFLKGMLIVFFLVLWKNASISTSHYSQSIHQIGIEYSILLGLICYFSSLLQGSHSMTSFSS
uniref:Calpain small subunit 1-like n=1 Tax=Cyprinus carpio TaxID=7962 RepID=A0A8C2CRT5_CYPCA